MILTVAHRTVYRYDTPIRVAVQSLRLTPSAFDGQRVCDWVIGVEGGQKGAGFRDGAGDWVEGWSLRGPAEEVAVRVTGTVETSDLSGLLTGHRETVHPGVYMRETLATRADAGIVELNAAVSSDRSDALGRAHALSAAVAEAIAYRPGATEAHTTAAEALALGEGVCQDHAHALIACARLSGLPARYVSGYLFATEDGSPHEAAHAWAEIWIAGLGWIGFDPANRCCPDARYIRIGSGLDARDAAPIRGVARGASSETLEVSVAVGQSQQ
ncbi:MAG: transglutaminase family protein [Rhodobacteraceae bacterium]|nr:transglutaminase family protein [Paracoccaceae bacterium]